MLLQVPCHRHKHKESSTGKSRASQPEAPPLPASWKGSCWTSGSGQLADGATQSGEDGRCSFPLSLEKKGRAGQRERGRHIRYTRKEVRGDGWKRRNKITDGLMRRGKEEGRNGRGGKRKDQKDRKGGREEKRKLKTKRTGSWGVHGGKGEVRVKAKGLRGS